MSPGIEVLSKGPNLSTGGGPLRLVRGPVSAGQEEGQAQATQRRKESETCFLEVSYLESEYTFPLKKG